MISRSAIVRCGLAAGLWGAAAMPAGADDGLQIPLGSTPPVWGYVGTSFYGGSSQEAPNGLRYHSLLSLDSELDVGLLQDKYFYAFVDGAVLLQRSGASPREFDTVYGLGWNYWDRLELRAWGYSDNNLNRGVSLANPNFYQDGTGVENRYYFGPANPYDVGRLDYISLAYDPSKTLVGMNGQSFRPTGFAELHLAQNLPLPVNSYVYGDVRVTAQTADSPRLVDTDIGVAVRPLESRQDLELRLGYKRTDDLKAGSPESVVYAAARLIFGVAPTTPQGSATANVAPSGVWSFLPDIWGVAGLPIYPTGKRTAPNGVSFVPIFGLNGELNIGLAPQKLAYLFWNGDFWAQHSGAGATNSSQGALDFSRRETDSDLGVAWNYFDSLELRTSFYMLNNLNRGTSLLNPEGGKEGFKLENRYYLPTTTPYDVGRLDFVSIGYVPAGDMIGENGANFHPGAFARAYLTADLPILDRTNYVFIDLQAMAREVVTPRLLTADFGWALRPFEGWQNFELRVGSTLSDDLRGHGTHDTAYVALRVDFDPTGFTAAPPSR